MSTIGDKRKLCSYTMRKYKIFANNALIQAAETPTHWHNKLYMPCDSCDDLLLMSMTLVAVGYEGQFTLLCQWA